MFGRLERLVDAFAPFDDRTMPPTSTVAFLWHYLRPVRFWLWVVFGLSVFVGVVESGLYLLIGRFVDLLAHASPATIWAEHGTALTLAGALILIGRPLAHGLGEIVSNQILVPQLTTMIRWRAHLYTLGHSLSYFQGDFAGRLSNRITQLGPAIREIAVTLLDTLVYVAIFAIAAIGLFASISLWLVLPMVVWLSAYLLLMGYFIPRAQARSLANAEGRSLMVGRITDSYTNIQTVKLFARQDDERSSVRDALGRWMAAFLDLMRLITGVNWALTLLNSTLLFCVASLSLHLWTQGRMSSGDAAAGLALVMRILAMSGWVMQTLRGLFENIGIVQEAMTTIARPHAVTDAPNSGVLAIGRGEIRFENVRFHYGREGGILDDLTFTVRPGEKVGLVGPSGAGKSTIVSLLLRLHDREGGRILIDGQDIARLRQDSLRREIGVVTQDNSLLHRSIRENVAYGRLDASVEEIDRALALARADEFLPDLVDHKGRRGLDAHVGERGVKLSGGQRQRIAIARVILKNAPILVLDEATSALDSEVEAAIQGALAGLMEGKTVLAIAHRLSTVAALDRLIVLDHGRIVEEGSHAELLARGGLYARLWRRQSGGFLGQSEDNRAVSPV